MSKTAPHSIGRYEVVAPLATGGMGELFIARRSGAAGFARLVVLKRLRPELGATATYRDMFFDEARLAARLGHPNVCEVYDLEEDGDEHYLAMPYLEGVAAGALLTGEGPLDIAHARVVAGILVQVCDGLHHAHELRDDDGVPMGVVHRDVSPGNVFVTSDGVVKLLDFGVAKARGAATVTDQGVVKGKLAYMAPEQLAGGAIDRRADVFCVGILGWEGLVGRSLFARGSASLTAAAVLDEPIAPVASAVDGAPAELAAVIDRALAREPGRRPATAAVLREAIEAAMAGHGGVARPAELARTVAARCGDEIAEQRERVRRKATATVTATATATATVTVTATATATATVTVTDTDPVTDPATDPVTVLGRVRGRSPPPRRSTAGWRIAAIGGAAIAIAAGTWVAIGRGSRATRTGATDARAVGAGDALTNPIDAAAITPPPIDAGTLDGAAAVRVRAPGWVSIDSKPWAELFIDGKRVGITPYIHKSIAAGNHAVRAVLADGRTKQLSIAVPEGRDAAPVDLRW